MLAWLFVWVKVQILQMAQLMPLPLTVSCSSKSRLVLPLGFTFLVPAYLGSSGQNKTHNRFTQPFFGYVEFVRDNPGEPVPEETFTHYSLRSHQSSLSAFSI